MSSVKCARALSKNQKAFAKSSPPIDPLAMPTTVFDGVMELSVCSTSIELRPLDVHSFDGLTIYFPKTHLLLAGDTVEDTVTYVAEPHRLEIHCLELERLATWGIETILPTPSAARQSDRTLTITCLQR